MVENIKETAITVEEQLQEPKLKVRTGEFDWLEKHGLTFYALVTAVRTPKLLFKSKVRTNSQEIFNAVSKAVPDSRSLDQEIYLLGDYEIKVDGLEDLPEKGPFIIASNYQKLGPLEGKGATVIAPTSAVSERFTKEDGQERKIRYIIESEKKFKAANLEGKINANSYIPQFVKSALKGPFEVAKDFVDKRIDHINSNIIQTYGLLPVGFPAELMTAIKDDQSIIGIFPGGEPAEELNEGLEEAGNFFRLVTANRIPVHPLSISVDENNKKIYLLFGEAISREKLMGKNYRKIVDEVMIAIGRRLSPKEQGVYRQKIAARNEKERLEKKTA